MNYIVLDTETCPLDETLERVSAENMFAYDIGWLICNDKGEILKTRSFVNADIFLGEKDLMANAFYADKIPQYWREIKNGERVLTSFYKIRKQFVEDINEYNIIFTFAHNCKFDLGTLNNTQRWLTKSKFNYFFPYKIIMGDTMKMAQKVLGKDENYKVFCKENNYLTKNNRVQMKAETIYRFLENENDFEEKHTSLEDCLIEMKILLYCLKYLDVDEGRLF